MGVKGGGLRERIFELEVVPRDADRGDLGSTSTLGEEKTRGFWEGGESKTGRNELHHRGGRVDRRKCDQANVSEGRGRVETPAGL